MRGKTLGIIGYGHVGSQLSILAEAMGMCVIYYDIQRKLPLGNAQPVSSQKQLLANSQFVSLHVPMTPDTKNLISHKVNIKYSELDFRIPTLILTTWRHWFPTLSGAGSDAASILPDQLRTWKGL